ncbi:MAG: hypothetical protein Q9M33_08985 [Robiginitomaculum sp.]|nr:hypothetical protein [Robiginitomaculum sp.]MDQ7076428.1 hypothetical protein [Robiginitomaculum sp.]
MMGEASKRLFLLALLALGACVPAKSPTGVEAAFAKAKAHQITLREFIYAMPKGGDLHTHLYGTVYAESWLRWASEDGYCIDKTRLTLQKPKRNCADQGFAEARTALGDQAFRNQMIDRLSMRDFWPKNGWSGHDQFFSTFSAIALRPDRRADMIAEAANRAGEQGIAYLELTNTMELFETILPLVVGLPMSGDMAKDYQTLMQSEFGKQLPAMVTRARADMDTAMARKDALLGCQSDTPQPGCAVTIRFQSQSVRTLPPAAVFAHFIFGWHLVADDPRFVGINLVAPEDDFVALRDYRTHMAQLDYLYRTLGPRNISLHAGELALGLVPPKDLRFHITEAITRGHAKRIGHGIDIIHETGYGETLKTMAKDGILVEVNLTSNDVILGIKGDAHPFYVYRNAGVPMAFSTDDEGIARIDMTHELVRAVQDFDLGYDDLKTYLYNSLRYAFVDEPTKAKLIADLDARFARFESGFK